MAIIVLGAGIVGLTLVNLLARNSDIPIILIDTKAPEFNYDPSYYDLRCSAINHATQSIWRELDLWDAITAHRVSIYKNMVVWDNFEHNKLEFNAAELGLQNLGCILENRSIHQALYRNLDLYPQVQKVFGVAEQICATDAHIELKINNTNIYADLIVGADGANSWLRGAAKISCTEFDYQQQALVATITSQWSHQDTAWQRFTPEGNVAFLPLDDPHKSSIVWVGTQQHMQDLLLCDAEQFCTELTSTFDYKLGALKLDGARASFALRRLDAQRYIAARVALIGDAAHVMHPMAGQGLNTGITDAYILAKCLKSAAASRADLGHELLLRRYERHAKGANALILQAVDRMHKLFRAQTPVLKFMRNSGMRILNEINFFKRQLANVAVGTHKKDFI